MKKGLFISALGLLLGACTTQNDTVIDGASLYSGNCQRCHGAEGLGQGQYLNIQGKSADTISFKLSTVQQMAGISLNSDEIAAIAQYLAGFVQTTQSKPAALLNGQIMGPEDGVVVLKDQQGETRQDESVDGQFSINISGLTPPFLVEMSAEDGLVGRAIADNSLAELAVSDESTALVDELLGDVDLEECLSDCMGQITAESVTAAADILDASSAYWNE